jgi:cell division protein FtsL
MRRRETVNRIMLMVTGILIVMAVFVYITRMGQIHELSKQASFLESEITQLNEDKQFKEVELAAAQNIARIKDEAIRRLGMVEPSEEQIRRIPIKGYLR